MTNAQAAPTSASGLVKAVCMAMALLLFCSCSSPAGADRERTTTGSASFGVAQDSHYDFDKIEPMVRGSDAVGLKWLRMQVLWENIQPTGPDDFNWPQYDLMFEKLRGSGLQVIGVLNGTPGWARSADCREDNCPPADPARFARFAAVLAERYRLDVRAWEVWNEPNLIYSWGPAPDPRAYTRLLRETYHAVKKAAPEVTVVSAGLSPAGTMPGSLIAPVEFLSEMYRAGAGGSFDALGWHPYTGPDLSQIANPGADNAWTQMSETPISARSLMVANGDGDKQIWATEFGVSTMPGEGTEDAQAAVLDEAIRRWAEYDFAGPLILYNYRDRNVDLGNANSYYGLVRYDGTPKVAVEVVARAIADVR